jgi:hypothetical protein
MRDTKVPLGVPSKLGVEYNSLNIKVLPANGGTTYNLWLSLRPYFAYVGITLRILTSLYSTITKYSYGNKSPRLASSISTVGHVPRLESRNSKDDLKYIYKHGQDIIRTCTQHHTQLSQGP